MKIGILGAGALAIALTKVLEEENHDITLWTKFESEKEELVKTHENVKLLPGVKIGENVKVTNDIKEAVIGREIIINVLPFIAVRDTIELLKAIYDTNQIIVSATKGLDYLTFETTTDLFIDELNAKKIAAISGPSFAIEIVNKESISFMLGSEEKEVLDIISKLLGRDYLKFEKTEDIEGIQIAGGIKNAIAVGSGMLDGLNAADSTKAAYLAKAMADMSKLIVKLGGKKESAYSYAGIGDLILTCMSHTSRNNTFGRYLGMGLSVKEAFDKMEGKTVEGYNMIRTLYKFVESNNIDTYTIKTIYNIIFEGQDVNSIRNV